MSLPPNSGPRDVSALEFFAHIYADSRGWLVAFTGRQARMDDPNARANDLGKSTRTRSFRYPAKVAEAAEFLQGESDAGRDAYQGVHLYKTAAGRKGENAVDEVWSLWLDEDEGEYPSSGPDPTAIVRSSEGRRHLYWRLSRPVPIDQAVALSRRIAVWAGGDRGKAARATVLRTPGTTNYKRHPQVDPVVGELTETPPWDPEVLEQAIPPVQDEERDHATSEPGEPPVRLTPGQLEIWRGEAPIAKDDGTGEIDRSRTLWNIAGVLHDAGATRTSIAAALQERDETLGYRKYTNRPDHYDEIAGKYQGRERTTYAKWATGAAPGPDAPIPDGPGRTYERTDTGNGERFANEHGRNMRWISKWGKHLIWTGRVWTSDDREEVSRKAQATAKGIHADATRPGIDTDEQRKISRHAINSQNAPRIRAMIDLAKPYMAASHTDFDPDPWLLNCQNGTIDLRTGELREHRRSDLITKVTPAEYDPDATAPTFRAFLEQIIPNERIRGFVQRAFGMAMAGEIRDNVLIILHGTGSNGKTTLVQAIMDAFGEYAIASAPDLLMSKANSHPTELADLFGARLVSCMESEEGRRLNEGLVKQLTGRDKIKARRMREDFWEFDPTHTVFLGTNHKPEIRGTDHAIWRRLKLVPFEVTIPDAEQDKDLPTKLQGELPGILRWLVEGCLEWQRGGLQEPDEVKAATKDYRADMDILEQFIEDCCVVHSGAQAPATPLYTRYQQWCETNGEKAVSQRAFGTRLGERGFDSFRFTGGPHKDAKGWAGIGLRAEEHDPDDDPEGGGTPKWGSHPHGGADKRTNERTNENAGSGLGMSNSPSPTDARGQSGPESDINSHAHTRDGSYTESRSASSASSANGVESCIHVTTPGVCVACRETRDGGVFVEGLGRLPKTEEEVNYFVE